MEDGNGAQEKDGAFFLMRFIAVEHLQHLGGAVGMIRLFGATLLSCSCLCASLAMPPKTPHRGPTRRGLPLKCLTKTRTWSGIH